MTEEQLKEQLQEFYGNQTLPEKSIRRIRKAGKPRLAPALISTAAAIVTLAAVATWQIGQGRVLTAAVADEIAESHRNRAFPGTEPLPMNIAELQAAMNLPVNLTDVESTLGQRFDILNCRACVLNGEDAVRLQVRERQTKRTGTLYIAGLTRALARLPENVLLSDVEVEFWNDGSYCFGFCCDCGES
ncbi:MAG: hypothetical protein AAF585_07595 [Verrucomicrobiota bacterium]